MHRVLISPTAIRGGSITIRHPATVHHLVRVLRLTIGDRVECFDGAGRIALGSIARTARGELTINVERESAEPPPSCPVTLAVALIQPQRFEWVLEKATELGVAHVIPLVSSRTAVRVSSSVPPARMERWTRIMESAAAQCGRAILPTCEEPRAVAGLLEHLRGRPAMMLTLVPGSAPLSAGLRALSAGRELTALIGPEGDFSPEEVALARQCGVWAVHAGRSILRTETAAIALLAVLQHALGAWDEHPRPVL